MTTQDHAIEADFIVIGAGSAGCAVAARLSEDPATRVLLLEAGGEDNNRWIHIPLGFGKTFADPSVNWCYETEPDPGAADRRVYWPRGKVLGGSSSINGMVYIRGQAEDFEFHGTDGPLCVSDVPDHHPICEAFIDAALGLGYPRNDDFNGARQDGVGYHQTTTRNGRRCSTAVGYLRPAMQRRNLQVVTEALSDKILFEGRRAIGVAFNRNGRRYEAHAAREIILCGGAVNSPQLLLLSGIGPQEHLAALGIPLVQHVPGVGQSLQDHYSAPLKLKCRVPITLNDVMQSNAKKLKVGLEYYAHPAGTGVTRRQTVDPAIQRRPSARRAASVVRVFDDRLSAASGQSRPDHAEERQSGRSAGGLSELPDRRDRSADDRRRAEAVPPAARPTGVGAAHRVGVPAGTCSAER